MRPLQEEEEEEENGKTMGKMSPFGGAAKTGEGGRREKIEKEKERKKGRGKGKKGKSGRPLVSLPSIPPHCNLD